MQKPEIPESKNDAYNQFIGIIHIAFSLGAKEKVDKLTNQLKTNHIEVDGPRETEYGCYETTFLDPEGNQIRIFSNRDISAGFRRIFYDAMILSYSLCIIRDCKYYSEHKADDIDGNVESNQANALIQIRSMLDFLNPQDTRNDDTMRITDFNGCSKQNIECSCRKALHKYVAHKSWDAVNKDVSAEAGQLTKEDIVDLGLKTLEGFDVFMKECLKNNKVDLNHAYTKKYKDIFEKNYKCLKCEGR
jgi:hypothetical protein